MAWMPSIDPLAGDDWCQWVEPLLRDRLQCVYCGLDGKSDLATFRQLALHLDHLVPKSLGGNDAPDNLVTSCWPCNKVKGAFDPRDYDENGQPKETPRERMVENVKAKKLRGDWKYNETARNALLAKLAT